MNLSPATKQGVYLAVYLFIIGTFLGSYILYTGTINTVSKALAPAIGITAGIILAVIGLISGFIFWHITNWLRKITKFNNPAVIQGILFTLGAILSFNLVGILVGFLTGYILWWLSTDSKIW